MQERGHSQWSSRTRFSNVWIAAPTSYSPLANNSSSTINNSRTNPNAAKPAKENAPRRWGCRRTAATIRGWKPKPSARAANGKPPCLSSPRRAVRCFAASASSSARHPLLQRKPTLTLQKLGPSALTGYVCFCRRADVTYRSAGFKNPPKRPLQGRSFIHAGLFMPAYLCRFFGRLELGDLASAPGRLLLPLVFMLDQQHLDAAEKIVSIHGLYQHGLRAFGLPVAAQQRIGGENGDRRIVIGLLGRADHVISGFFVLHLHVGNHHVIGVDL